MTNFLDDGRKFDNEEERFAAFTIAQEASLLTELEEHLDNPREIILSRLLGGRDFYSTTTLG